MFFILLILWIIFNGNITLEIVLIGAAVSALLYLFACKFLDYSPKKDLRLFLQLFKRIKYACILVAEVFKANIQVIRLILTSKYEVEPCLCKFTTDLKDAGTKVALANSITLTPGTITVSLIDNEYVVHCLDKELSEGMDESVFVKQLRKIER